MREFYTHPVFADLPLRAARLVSDWVHAIQESEPGILPTAVADAIREVVFDGFDSVGARPQYQGIPGADWQALDRWVQTDQYAAHFSRAVEQLGLAAREPQIPKATDGQVRILTESMEEAGVDLTRLLAHLTRYEADLLIKGCIVVSEVLRQTGDRHFAIKDLRQAVRRYLDPRAASAPTRPIHPDFKRQEPQVVVERTSRKLRPQSGEADEEYLAILAHQIGTAPAPDRFGPND